MKEIGEKLKARREELGLSLQEVQQETKIRTKYLQALEDGDDSVIPGTVYVRGFIRSYADYLGLDGIALAQEYKNLKPSHEPKSAQPEKKAEVQVGQKSTPRRKKSNWNFGVVLILVIVLGASIAMINWWDTNKETFAPVDPPPISEPKPEEPLDIVDEPDVEPEPTPEPVVEVEMVENGQEIIYLVSVTDGEIPGLELVVSVTQRCWVEIRADREVVLSGTLEPGENHVFTAVDEIYVRAGNPAGLDLTVNEHHVGYPSPVGPKTIYVRWQE